MSPSGLTAPPAGPLHSMSLTHCSLYHMRAKLAGATKYSIYTLKKLRVCCSSYKLSLEVSSPGIEWQLQNHLKSRLFTLISLLFSTHDLQLIAQNCCFIASHCFSIPSCRRKKRVKRNILTLRMFLVIRDKERHLLLTKGSTHQDDITIPDLYGLHKIAAKCMKQKCTKLEEG